LHPVPVHKMSILSKKTNFTLFSTFYFLALGVLNPAVSVSWL
jgi:hypothetical protein